MTAPLYLEIAESMRQAIFYGELKAGEELPSVRELAARWSCAPGTVQRAYRELVRQGLVTSRPGQGTRVLAPTVFEQPDPLRRAALAHEAEAFLLRVLSSGHTVSEAESAIRLALDRWRAISAESAPVAARTLRFVGSHEPAISTIAATLTALAPDHALDISFAGSLAGLIALAEGKTDVAGCHLWDEETDTYNAAFVRRLLPGRRTALLTLAHRRLGLILTPGNPLGVTGLADLVSPGLRFINRQPGAGTRVWLDAQLHRAAIDPAQITGYDEQVMTHVDVARAVAEGRADAGLGIETAALAYGLDFHFLTSERYDLAIPDTVWALDPFQRLAEWLASAEGRARFERKEGYDNRETGRVQWVG